MQRKSIFNLARAARSGSNPKFGACAGGGCTGTGITREATSNLSATPGSSR